jgi:hypothetical protein
MASVLVRSLVRRITAPANGAPPPLIFRVMRNLLRVLFILFQHRVLDFVTVNNSTTLILFVCDRSFFRVNLAGITLKKIWDADVYPLAEARLTRSGSSSSKTRGWTWRSTREPSTTKTDSTTELWCRHRRRPVSASDMHGQTGAPPRPSVIVFNNFFHPCMYRRLLISRRGCSKISTVHRPLGGHFAHVAFF